MRHDEHNGKRVPERFRKPNIIIRDRSFRLERARGADGQWLDTPGHTEVTAVDVDLRVYMEVRAYEWKDEDLLILADIFEEALGKWGDQPDPDERLEYLWYDIFSRDCCADNAFEVRLKPVIPMRSVVGSITVDDGFWLDSEMSEDLSIAIADAEGIFPKPSELRAWLANYKRGEL